MPWLPSIYSMKLYIKRKFIENFLLLYDLKFVHKHKHHHKHDAHFHFLYVNNEQSFLVYNYKVHEYIFFIIVSYIHNRSFLLIEADQMFSLKTTYQIEHYEHKQELLLEALLS